MSIERSRTEVPEVFQGDQVPVERFGMASAERRPDPNQFLEQAMRQSEYAPAAPVGRIKSVFLGKREIDFGRNGPLLSITRERKWMVPVPVFEIPLQKVFLDARGRPLTHLPAGNQALRVRVEPRAVKLEAFAESSWNGAYVIQPVTEILLQSLDASASLMVLRFHPVDDGRYPALLYEPRSGRLQIYGGLNFQMT